MALGELLVSLAAVKRWMLLLQIQSSRRLHELDHCKSQSSALPSRKDPPTLCPVSQRTTGELPSTEVSYSLAEVNQAIK